MGAGGGPALFGHAPAALGALRRLHQHSPGQSPPAYLSEDGICGHDADGAVNEDYCKWCYDGGQFLQDCTMEEMAGTCADIIVKEHGGDREQIRAQLLVQLPCLGRWKQG